LKKDIISALMHPIRIRIIQELGIKGDATTKELQAACGDYGQATIYRHLKEMLEYELIKVVNENNINGIIEKVYGLNEDLGSLILGNPEELKKDDYLILFTQYIMSIMSDFSAYFEQDNALQEVTENIGFTSSSIFLSDEELKEMMLEMAESMMKRIINEPKEGRKLRKISSITTTVLNKDKE